MGLKGLTALPRGAGVLVDSAPIAYVLDGHPLAGEFAPLFERAEAGDLRLFTTPITVAEVVAGPIGAGREAQAERYRIAMTSGPGVTFVALGDEAALLAARFRNRYRLKLPDAFQLAACVLSGCQALATHDRDFRRVSEVLVIDTDSRR
jgi:predicted nucleic acid-binding protein